MQKSDNVQLFDNEAGVFEFYIVDGSYVEFEFSTEKYLPFALSDSNKAYNNLLEIESFLQLEESLSEKYDTKKLKLLFVYINNYEAKCTDPVCHLKSFLKIPLKPKNYEILRILLLQHAELLFKHAISKHPFNIKLRIFFMCNIIFSIN